MYLKELYQLPIFVACAAATADGISRPTRNHLSNRNSNEAVILANCVDPSGAAAGSQAAYFADYNSHTPDDTIVVPGPNGGYHVWEGGSNQQVTFSSGTTFSWDIEEVCPIPGLYAGTANNGYGSFSCYTASNPSWGWADAKTGASCQQRYLCTHQLPAINQACTVTNISFATSGSFVTLPDDFPLNANDILSKIWTTFDNSSSTDVSSSSIDLNDGVSISFSGHGAIGGKTLLAGAIYLVNTLGNPSNGAMNTQTKTARACIDVESCCNIDGINRLGRRVVNHPCNRCCQYGDKQWTSSTMLADATVHLDQLKYDSSGQASSGTEEGFVSYRLTYNPPAPDCGLFEFLDNALSVIGLIPEAEDAVGVIQATSGIVAEVSGC